METKLQTLITKIKASKKLKSDEKEYLYKLLHDSIASIVWPVLVRYMDEKDLKRLAEDPQQVTPENYQELVQSALDDGEALVEIDQMVDKIIAKTEEILAPQLN